MSHKTKPKQGAIEWAMRNRQIILIITAVLMIFGVVALMKMPRNEFPQFTIRQGLVIGVYPGATSAEVEEQLTKKVENYIFGYQEVRKAKTYSNSKEGMMIIYVELNDDIKNSDQFWSKLKHGLGEMKSQLPTGVVALIANSDFGDTAALLITLSSDSRSYRELETELTKLEAECRKIPSVSKIKDYGLQKEQVDVKVKSALLNEYNIKAISLLANYMPTGMVSYAGSLDDGKKELPVHFPTSFESEKDLGNQIVYSDPNGNIVKLKDIATIQRRYEDPDNFIRQNGMKTLLLSLEMQPGNNIVQFGKDVDKALEAFKQKGLADVKVEKISNLPQYVDDSVSNFLREFMIAIIAVIFVTMLLLPFRVASVAGITIPISILITLALLYAFGIELNTVTLAALIVVLGMIVDNSIVVIDSHVEKIDHGYSPWYAAIKSAKELFIPVVAATLAICVAFFPLKYFLSGMAGEFLQDFPVTIGIALSVSVAVAVLLVPYLNFVFIKKGLNKPSSNKKSLLDSLQTSFDRALEWAFRNPKMILGSGAAIVVISFIIFSRLDQQTFPEVERNQMAVEVYLPSGSSLDATQAVIDSLEHTLMKDNRITNVTSFVGTSSPRFHTVYAPNMPSASFGQLLLNTTTNEATKEISESYEKQFDTAFPLAHIKWKRLSMMSTKAPIEIRISGDTIANLYAVKAKVEDIMRKTAHISWIRTDWDQPQQYVQVNMDNEKADRMGYSKGLAAIELMASLDGLPLTTLWEGDYPVNVKLYYEQTAKPSISTIQDQYITSPSSFSSVPLRSLSTLTPGFEEGTIVRRNGVRTLTVLADVEDGVVASNVFNVLKPQLEKLATPSGTTITYGGEAEDETEVMIPMAISLGVSIILIFFILLFQFQRTDIASLIMLTMLLGFPGAAIGLWVMGYPFGVTAFMGIISLCGIVVRNGIILIDYVRELNEKGMTVREAALAAGKRRMRPIFLTSAAAAVGVIPMIISRSPLWGPLGTIIAFGLLISMVLTLFILPVLYTIAFRKKDKTQLKGRSLIVTASIIGILMFGFSNNSQAQTLSLDSCKQLALQNNREIKATKYEIEAAQQEKKNAFTNYFPKVSADVFAMRSSDYLVKGSTPKMDLPVYDGNPANLATATQFAYVPAMSIGVLDYLNMVSVMATQPIYAGGQIMNGNKMASVAITLREQQKSMTETDVLIRTEELYWNTVALYEKLKTINDYQLMLDSLARDVKVSCDAGLVHRSDLLKVQLKQTDLRNNRLKLKNGIVLSKLALCQLVGISSIDADSLKLDLTMPTKSISLADLQIGSVEDRSEYKMLDNLVTIKKLDKKMSIGANMPQLAVGVNAFSQDAMNVKYSCGLVFVTLSIPISDWWGGYHKIKQKQININLAQNKLAETTDLLNLQMQQTKQQAEESFFEIEYAKEGVVESTEHLKVITDNYQSGVSSTSDLLEAKAMHQQALDNLTDSRCRQQIAIAKFLQAVGKYN